MKLVLISDTHTQHRNLKIPECDIILHAGDISHKGELENVYDFINWYANQPAKYKIFISGNHDFSFQDGSRKNKIREALVQHPDVIYLEDDYIEIEGIKIYGTPWQPRFFDWAFNANRGEELRDIWAKIPEDIDILIVHGPPYGYGDMVYGGERVGCKDLLRRLEIVKPKLCIYGHIHEGYGMYTLRVLPVNPDLGLETHVTCVNASVLDSQYFLVNDPVVIDYEDFI